MCREKIIQLQWNHSKRMQNWKKSIRKIRGTCLVCKCNVIYSDLQNSDSNNKSSQIYLNLFYSQFYSALPKPMLFYLEISKRWRGVSKKSTFCSVFVLRFLSDENFKKIFRKLILDNTWEQILPLAIKTFCLKIHLFDSSNNRKKFETFLRFEILRAVFNLNSISNCLIDFIPFRATKYTYYTLVYSY